MDTLFEWAQMVAQLLRLDLLGGLALATLLGGLIGWEREASGKPAGLRTNILICIGAALITDISVNLPGMVSFEGMRADPARLAAQIVSGIGFLGAGTILQSRGMVTGLTSAATLWVVASIGIAVGTHHYVEAVGTTVLVLAVLVPLHYLERNLVNWRKNRTMRTTLDREPEALTALRAAIQQSKLTVRKEVVTVDGDKLLVYHHLRGRAEAYQACSDALLYELQIHSLDLR